jgi:Na+/H+ antiporter NhaD/arsenite permease-like protein
VPLAGWWVADFSTPPLAPANDCRRDWRLIVNGIMVSRRTVLAASAAMAAVALASPARAADLDGAAMGMPWALPFAGILLSIALGPLLFAKFWHHHYGKIAAAWALVTLATIAIGYGGAAALTGFLHAILVEYLSFIVLLFALYTVAGGILVTGDLRGTPAVNLGILLFGTLVASLVGTTGAAMILIRPLIRANSFRKRNEHVVVFFIILVANIGGALSPLGDPPLFVGFLHGVSFFWPVQHLWLQTLIVVSLLLVIFYVFDICMCRAFETVPSASLYTEPIRVSGLINIALIAVIIGAILGSALWRPGISFDIGGVHLALESLVRDAVLFLTAFASLWLTHEEHRHRNGFTWEPILEVAKLFAGIFVCIIPVLAMLQAGHNGPFAWLLDAVTTRDGSPHEAAYFWLTGGLSAFLDNAPTYLVFFELASGDARELMGPLSGTLAAISMGAVYMGALTYIGNAPNLMVYSIAKEQGVNMPSFFGYLFWAACVLVPLFLILTLLPISPILKLA